MRVFMLAKGLEIAPGNVRELSEAEIAALPEYVAITLNEECLAIAGGNLYGTSAEHIVGEEI